MTNSLWGTKLRQHGRVAAAFASAFLVAMAQGCRPQDCCRLALPRTSSGKLGAGHSNPWGGSLVPSPPERLRRRRPLPDHADATWSPRASSSFARARGRPEVTRRTTVGLSVMDSGSGSSLQQSCRDYVTTSGTCAEAGFGRCASVRHFFPAGGDARRVSSDPGGDRTRGLRIKSQEGSEPVHGIWRKVRDFSPDRGERGGLKLPDDEPKLVG